MEVHVAKSAGFCFGVKRAVKMALETAKEKEKEPVYMLGDIVHNEHVVRELDDAGIQVIESLDQIESGTLVIRAHGVIPEIYEIAQNKGIHMLDATCPLVLEIHNVARQLQTEGYTLVVIGDHDHDEVVGIAGQVESTRVISAPEEAHAGFDNVARLGVVVQSTQNIENVQQIIAVLASKCRELKFFNTICGPTKQHQQDIRDLPHTYNVIIVIGSHTSANTCRLTAIARGLNPHTHQVESADDVKAEWFEGASSVGVSAGASTPDVVIRQVIEKIRAI